MKVYQQEILDGLSEQIKAQASVAYCAPAVLVQDTGKDAFCDISHNRINKIKASSNPNQIDLYYIKSVLVSTGWNKNDDVFNPEETWAARTTPEDKQFNFMHNENDIIGHITGSYVVDREGNKLSDTEEAPVEFDIITEAVLYNSWTNPDNRERMKKIIAEIEDGKWFVSMECLFAGFDYAIIDKTGNSRVITRSEESSFLTKHLRAYGGTGEYEGYKIGRSLRDISFSGKGLVSRPANPRSVILDSSKAFSVTNDESSISFVSKGDINMSDTNLEKQLADLQVELASSQEEIKTAKADLEVVQKDFAEKVSVLENSLAEREAAIKSYEDKIANLETVLASKEQELSDLSAAMKDMQKKEKDRMRKDKLVMAGFEDAEAEESVSLYDALSDEAFEAVVAGLKKKMGALKEKMTKEEKKEMASEATVAAETVTEVVAEPTPEIFEEVKSTEATLVDASDVNDELEATRASVAEWLTQNVLRK